MVQKEIAGKILTYLKRQDWPITTKQVAEELKVAWNTAQVHLLKLVMERKVKFKRVGRQNEFCIVKKKQFGSGKQKGGGFK